ncbi:MAG: hypothetical protein Q9227_003764 [Pyrenula ochraceoflavens]
MIEESIPTWEAYCKHQEISALNADQEASKHYQEIVATYANFGSSKYWQQQKSRPSRPIEIRWKMTSLQAVKAVVDSEALGADGGKQLYKVMPVILENLYSGDEDIIAALQQKAQASEKTDMAQARKRRMSVATVATVDTVEANPASASGTAADADKVAEEEVRVLAVRSLKQIFTAGISTNRGQIRTATTITLRFIANRKPTKVSQSSISPRAGRQGSWATSLMETVTRWTPVAERFIIVVTAVDTLLRSPVTESNLEEPLTLATMIDWLLSSSINLIGLSVMDVLLGFIQHVLLLLQLGGRDSKLAPHPQQKEAIDLFHDTPEQSEGNEESRGRAEPEAITPSPTRQALLLCLQKCISSLATHIYYTDQIADMLQAILARLKPSNPSDIPSTAQAIEQPVVAANAIADSASLNENPATDGFFSFATARVTALKACKDILFVANHRRALAGAAAEARSRVNIQVWEGTQWLLRDEDREVRLAYAEALLTWLRLETNKNDLLIAKEGLTRKKTSKRRTADNGDPKVTQRAVSSASQREKKKPSRSTFLQLLHLAIYDNALEQPENESDILLLHLLLTQLTERLGVNSARNTVPMIFRLQQDINNEPCLSTPKAKVNVASLTHGYLWALSEKFDFETSHAGMEIHSEVSRRKEKKLWCERIRLPPAALEQIRAPTSPLSEKNSSPASEVSPYSFKFFNNRNELVADITSAYNKALTSPMASPPGSPAARVFSVPSLGFGYGYGASPSAGSKLAPEDQLPEKVQDDLGSIWSKESCLAAVERESKRASSLSGSKAGTGSGTKNNYLSVNGNENSKADESTPRDGESPIPRQHNDHTNAINRASYGLLSGLGSLTRFRRSSTQDGSPHPLTPSSSRESTIRVNELKRVLSMKGNMPRHSSPLGVGRNAIPHGKSSGISKKPFISDIESSGSSSSESLSNYSDAGDRPRTASKTNLPNGFAQVKPHSKNATGVSQSRSPSVSPPSTANTETRESALRALEGSHNSSPVRSPLTNQQASTSHLDLNSSTLSQHNTNVSPLPQTSVTTPPISPRPRSNSDTHYPSKRDAGYFMTSSPRRDNIDDDIPPVPKIPSSLNLPGGFPMDTSSSKSPSPERRVTRKSSRGGGSNGSKPTTPTTPKGASAGGLDIPKDERTGGRKGARQPSPTGTATILPRQTSFTYKLNQNRRFGAEEQGKVRPSTAPGGATATTLGQAQAMPPPSTQKGFDSEKEDAVGMKGGRGRKSAKTASIRGKDKGKAVSGYEADREEGVGFGKAKERDREKEKPKVDLMGFLEGINTKSSNTNDKTEEGGEAGGRQGGIRPPY